MGSGERNFPAKLISECKHIPVYTNAYSGTQDILFEFWTQNLLNFLISKCYNYHYNYQSVVSVSIATPIPPGHELLPCCFSAVSMHFILFYSTECIPVVCFFLFVSLFSTDHGWLNK